MEHHDDYLGKRVKRGLFKSYTGKELNADINCITKGVEYQSLNEII